MHKASPECCQELHLQCQSRVLSGWCSLPHASQKSKKGNHAQAVTWTGTGIFTVRSGGQCMSVMFSIRSVTALRCTMRGCMRHTVHDQSVTPPASPAQDGM
jgi:hypothetical protein